MKNNMAINKQTYGKACRTNRHETTGQQTGHKETYLKGLYKCPEQNTNRVTLAQEFDQTSCSKQSEEADIDEVFLC